MLRSFVIGLAVAFGIAGWSGQQGGQAAFPRPTLDTGPVHVDGSVSIVNTPAVQATQAGPWTVAVSALPSIEAATPNFVKAAHLYRLESNGHEVIVNALEVQRGDWILASRHGDPSTRSWYNLSQFQTVTDLTPGR